MHTVLAPNYGSPFVRDLDNGRRYGTIEDFRNLVKLTYMSPHLHHSGGTVCEPVDVPVNKRHLDMVYSHIRYSDKPFMGSVTAPERARDTVEMARIVFGADYLETHPVILSPDQRQLAARLGRDDARRGAGLRRGEPGDAAHAVHPRRGDGAGDRGRRLRPDARRGDGRDGVRPARPARRAGRPRARSRARCRCSRARRRSGRRSRRSSCTSWPRWPAGSASRSAPAATSAPRRSPTPRRRTRARRRSARRSSPASTSSSTRRAGSRAG